MSRAERLGIALRYTVEAIRELIDALHTGRVPSVLTATRAQHVYWSPSFIAGAEPTSPDSKPFSALLLSIMLGNATADRKTNRIVKLALLLLELHELGAVTDKDMNDIFEGADNFTQELLQTILTKTHTAYVEQTAQQEAIGILSASAK